MARTHAKLPVRRFLRACLLAYPHRMIRKRRAVESGPTPTLHAPRPSLSKKPASHAEQGGLAPNGAAFEHRFTPHQLAPRIMKMRVTAQPCAIFAHPSPPFSTAFFNGELKSIRPLKIANVTPRNRVKVKNARHHCGHLGVGGLGRNTCALKTSVEH
jgi:hypothetical protein